MGKLNLAITFCDAEKDYMGGFYPAHFGLQHTMLLYICRICVHEMNLLTVSKEHVYR